MRRKRNGIDKEKKRDNIFTIILSICDVIAVIVLFLLYGPYNNFRDWLVTTAMSTMRHQYIARTFYNDETINKVLERHSMIEPDGNTDTSLILEEDNNYIGNLTININKYKNNITIIDNLHYFNGEEKDSTRVMRLAISKNCTSYIECSTYRNYYSPNKKQINFAKLVFDSSGNLIDYCDNKNNDNTSIEIRKRNNPKVKYHIA